MKKIALSICVSILVFCLIVAAGLYLCRGIIKEYLQYRLIGPASYFDLDEITDASTLDLKIKGDSILNSQARPGKKVRKIELEFTSQNWHGSVWRHPARIYLPHLRRWGQESVVRLKNGRAQGFNQRRRRWKASTVQWDF